MPFVHKYKVVTLKSINCDRLLTGGFPELVNIDDVYPTASEKRRTIFVIELSFDARQLKLLLC